MEPEVIHTESVGSLVKGILKDLRSLVSEEVALAKLEIREQTMRAKAAAISLGAAAVALALAGIFFLIAAAMGIADMLDWPLWAGFLIVALLMGVIGAVAMTTGRKKLSAVSMVPDKTVSTLKENAEWISKRLSSARR